MDTSNIYRFNGLDPFDNWSISDGVLSGYYPRSSLINIFSNEIMVKDDSIVIPDGVVVIGCSCFRNNDYQSIIIPQSVKKINKNAFLNCKATLLIDNNKYIVRYAKRHKLNYRLINK